MRYQDYKENVMERTLEADPHGGYSYCRYCGREYYNDDTRGEQAFCSRTCQQQFHKLVVLQKKIEQGRAGKGYCPHKENCLNCPEESCIAERFAFAQAYCY